MVRVNVRFNVRVSVRLRFRVRVRFRASYLFSPRHFLSPRTIHYVCRVHENMQQNIYYIYYTSKGEQKQKASVFTIFISRLYKSNLGALNSDVQKWQNSNGTDIRSQRQNPSTFGRIKFKGHVHEIVIDQV